MADINSHTFRGKERESLDRPKRNRPPERVPRNLERVQLVIRLREEGLSWQKIADKIGTSRLAPRRLFVRWNGHV